MNEKEEKFLEALAVSVTEQATEGMTDLRDKKKVTDFMLVVIAMFYEVATLGHRRFGLSINKVIHIFKLTTHAFDVLNDETKKEIGL